MKEVTKTINSEKLTVAYSLPYHDWNLLERSKLWKRLNRYREACQTLNSKMSGNHNDIGRLGRCVRVKKEIGNKDRQAE